MKYILLLSIAVSAIMAIYARHNNRLSLYDYLKPITTILIIVLAIIGFDDSKYSYCILVILGLVFSLGGDILLLREKYFVFGLASFLVAHILFTIGIVSLKGMNVNVMPSLILITIGVVYYSYLKNHLDKYAIPVLLYCIAIVIMMHQAISLHLNFGHIHSFYFAIALASVLFAFSDGIIAYNKFIKELALGEVLILSTYWTSVTLFALSLHEI